MKQYIVDFRDENGRFETLMIRAINIADALETFARGNFIDGKYSNPRDINTVFRIVQFVPTYTLNVGGSN